MFLDIGQIVAGYTAESSGSLAAALTRGDLPDSDTTSAGGSVRYTDRPTITYSPLTGDRFLQGLAARLRTGPEQIPQNLMVRSIPKVLGAPTYRVLKPRDDTRL